MNIQQGADSSPVLAGALTHSDSQLQATTARTRRGEEQPMRAQHGLEIGRHALHYNLITSDV